MQYIHTVSISEFQIFSANYDTSLKSYCTLYSIPFAKCKIITIGIKFTTTEFNWLYWITTCMLKGAWQEIRKVNKYVYSLRYRKQTKKWDASLCKELKKPDN